MAKKKKKYWELEKFRTINGLRYERLQRRFLRKEDAIKHAERLRGMDYNVVRDKNSHGHFLWTRSKISDKERSKGHGFGRTIS